MFRLVIMFEASFMIEDISSHILLPSCGRLVYSMYTAVSSQHLKCEVKCDFHSREFKNELTQLTKRPDPRWLN